MYVSIYMLIEMLKKCYMMIKINLKELSQIMNVTMEKFVLFDIHILKIQLNLLIKSFVLFILWFIKFQKLMIFPLSN